jgi:hypothetical protein
MSLLDQRIQNVKGSAIETYYQQFVSHIEARTDLSIYCAAPVFINAGPDFGLFDSAGFNSLVFSFDS